MSKNDYIIPEKNIVPKDWVSLSDAEKRAMWLETDNISWIAYKETYRAIEQELKTKNGFSDIKDKNTC